MITINVSVAPQVAGLFPLYRIKVKKYSRNVLESCGVSKGGVNIVFIDNSEMTRLNEEYKKRRGPTDVLSFNLSDEGSPEIEGEVYVSLVKAQEQAGVYGVPFEEEIIRLVTHGLLHLAGYKHDTEDGYSHMMEMTDLFVKEFVTAHSTELGL